MSAEFVSGIITNVEGDHDGRPGFGLQVEGRGFHGFCWVEEHQVLAFYIQGQYVGHFARDGNLFLSRDQVDMAITNSNGGSLTLGLNRFLRSVTADHQGTVRLIGTNDESTAIKIGGESTLPDPEVIVETPKGSVKIRREQYGKHAHEG